MSIQDQKQLVRACLQGDRLAQKALYDHFKGKMYALCLRYASDQAEAEDMLLQGFYKVFRDLGQFNQGNSLEVHNPVRIQASIQVLSLGGRLITRQDIAPVEGNWKQDFNLSDLQKGYYLIRIERGEEVLVEKMLIQ
jgi:RNA polymerase sigma-70 factor (ECF subfamily)